MSHLPVPYDLGVSVPDFSANLVRGALIGAAETIPGVSGGTVALITGIYSRLIAAGKHLTDVGRAFITRGDWRAEFRRIDWRLLGPVALGAVVIVFSLAGIMETFVTEHPVPSKALFMGMIAVSVVIPFFEVTPGALRSGAARVRAAGLFVLGAAAAFTLTSLPRATMTDPPQALVFVAAAIAVSALVLPGVSGSFFLLVAGLYAPTLAAVDQLNIPYLRVFLLGAAVSFISFVRILEWILERHHTTAMVVAAGLLLGSLRALWPWQSETGAITPIDDDWPLALAMFAAGAALVAVVATVQRTRYAGDATSSRVELERRTTSA